MESHNLQDILSQLDAHQAARRLLGGWLVRNTDGKKLIGRIVETESYEETDRAAHSFGGPKGRNLPMYGPAGRAYVYLTYGMYHCMNVVVGPEGSGEAVLIRALEPLEGLSAMQLNRGLEDMSEKALCSGPGKLAQALKIDRTLNNHDLSYLPLQLVLKEPVPKEEVVVKPRIGIRHGAELLQRFYIQNSQFVSKL